MVHWFVLEKLVLLLEQVFKLCGYDLWIERCGFNPQVEKFLRWQRAGRETMLYIGSLIFCISAISVKK